MVRAAKPAAGERAAPRDHAGADGGGVEARAVERLGLDDGKPKTLEEVGKELGVTRARIRELQNIALAKLRRALAKREKPIVPRDPIQLVGCA